MECKTKDYIIKTKFSKIIKYGLNMKKKKNRNSGELNYHMKYVTDTPVSTTNE